MKKFLDFIYPNVCYSCNEFLDTSQKFICLSCLSELQMLTEYECFSFSKKYLKPDFVNCIIPYQFDESSQFILHLLKYKYMKPIAKLIAELIYKKFSKDLKKNKFSTILPCPLHTRKLKEREYNQAELIAFSLSELAHIPLDTDSLKRIRYTKTQTRLNKEQRKKNLENSFAFRNKKEMSRILIVDDVITTGTTLKMIAKAIHRVNSKIECTALAFASPIRL